MEKKAVKKIENPMNDLKINWANVKMLKIDAIIRMNNQKGKNPDKDSNNDTRIAPEGRDIKLGVITQEMKEVEGMIKDLEGIVKGINNVDPKKKFLENIEQLKKDMLDVVENIQDKINARNRGNGEVSLAVRMPPVTNSKTFLIRVKGDPGVAKDWT